MYKEDDVGSDLDEEPGGDQCQAAVLTVEAVVICVEGKVVQIEEPEKVRINIYILKLIIYKWLPKAACVLPQPVAFTGVRVAADGIILIGQPDNEDDVKGRCCVIEEL